eukprot:CAMPEP_0168360930 /NCGR_PEP_ID=MMETSP0228-20121227/2408_1 /TAXON_ID=133427 /ORGANISM="Protoceratium reticulatum, Strain CCCM 535 (=CCMP 1889)" /LENGTH=242 /DNA_ID=CAMNT_0008373599 /DNA_START=124 /DNA_END=849 /DNA_ORIENTATION=-
MHWQRVEHGVLMAAQLNGHFFTSRNLSQVAVTPAAWRQRVPEDHARPLLVRLAAAHPEPFWCYLDMRLIPPSTDGPQHAQGLPLGAQLLLQGLVRYLRHDRGRLQLCPVFTKSLHVRIAGRNLVRRLSGDVPGERPEVLQGMLGDVDVPHPVVLVVALRRLRGLALRGLGLSLLGGALDEELEAGTPSLATSKEDPRLLVGGGFALRVLLQDLPDSTPAEITSDSMAAVCFDNPAPTTSAPG